MHSEWRVEAEAKAMGGFGFDFKNLWLLLMLNSTFTLIWTLDFLSSITFMGDRFVFTPTSSNLGNNVNLKGLGTISLLLRCHTVSAETWKSLQFIFCFLPFALPNLTTVSFPTKIKFQSIPPTNRHSSFALEQWNYLMVIILHRKHSDLTSCSFIYSRG